MVRPVRPVRWLDKGLKRRHASSAELDNLVVLALHPDWVTTLPHGKLPDRQRFKRWRHDRPASIAAWTHAVGRRTAVGRTGQPTGWSRRRKTHYRFGSVLRESGRRYNLASIAINKSEKGTKVMTPRTSPVTTVAQPAAL